MSEQDIEREALAWAVDRAEEAALSYRRDGEHEKADRFVAYAERLRAREDGEAAARQPDGMCHATHWRRHLDEWDRELTIRAFDPEKCDPTSGKPPWPVWIGAAPVPVQDEGDGDEPTNESDVTATVRLALFYLRHNDLFPDEVADEMEEHLWHVLAEAGEHDAHAWLKSHAATAAVQPQQPSEEREALVEHLAQAMRHAAEALYFQDSSDYKSALWSVLHHLWPEADALEDEHALGSLLFSEGDPDITPHAWDAARALLSRQESEPEAEVLGGEWFGRRCTGCGRPWTEEHVLHGESERVRLVPAE